MWVDFWGRIRWQQDQTMGRWGRWRWRPGGNDDDNDDDDRWRWSLMMIDEDDRWRWWMMRMMRMTMMMMMTGQVWDWGLHWCEGGGRWSWGGAKDDWLKDWCSSFWGEGALCQDSNLKGWDDVPYLTSFFDPFPDCHVMSDSRVTGHHSFVIEMMEMMKIKTALGSFGFSCRRGWA